jgi:hypothetical protein
MSNLTLLSKPNKIIITKQIGLDTHKDYNSLFINNLLLRLVVSVDIN